MQGYFSTENLQLFLIVAVLCFLFGWSTGAFSKEVRESKEVKTSVIILVVICMVIHTAMFFSFRYSYHQNQKNCADNISQGYKMSGAYCYMPLKNGEYVKAGTPTVKL